MEKKTMVKKRDVLLKIFVSTLYLSAFTFGGGYVIVTLMKKKFVDEYRWIEEDEMLDLTAIAQSAPGAIAVNGAIVIGYKLAAVVFEMAGGIIHGKNPVSVTIMVLAFIAACFMNVNVIYVVLICGLIGVIRTLAGKRGK